VRLTIALFIVICGLTAAEYPPIKKFVIQGQAQGTTYQVIYYAGDSAVTKSQIDSLVDKIDSSLSLYKSYSLINRFNLSDSGAIIDDHFLTVLKKALTTFEETDRIFDVTVEPLVQAWGFGAKKITALPDSAAIIAIKKCIGSRNLQVYGNKVVKKKPCIKVDFNGIAQGYTVDLIAGLLDQHGLANYLVELGGEIRVRGRKQPGNEKMKVGIETPGEDEFERGIMRKVITIDEGAITTSGNYRRFYETEGKKVSHLIDPRTGYPVQNELISVTVYAKDAMTADAVDNALMVMGLKKAMEFIKERNELAAHFIYRDRNGSIKDTMSSRFRLLVQQ
jgi:thiamine biosynthesis lipoprotein